MANTEQAEKPSEVAATEPHPPIIIEAARTWGINPDAVFPFLLKTAMRPKLNKQGRVEYMPTKSDAIAFLIICMQYHLNPFKGEVYAMVDNSRVLPVVGVDGWINLIHSTGKFNGMEFDMVFPEGSTTKPFSCTCRLWMKGVDRPIEVTEYYNECNMSRSPVWSNRPIRMMRHQALKQAARLCGTGNGLYDQTEAEEVIYDDVPVTSRRSEPAPEGSVPSALLPENTEGSPVTLDAPEKRQPEPIIDGEAGHVDRDADMAAYSEAEAEEMAKNGDSSNSSELFEQ